MNIADKTVFITGANRGIGRALVVEALKRGAKRVYAGTRGPMEQGDARVTLVALDVTDASAIQRAAEQIDSLDVLINNAGIATYDDLSDFEVIERHLAVNFFGALRMAQAFLPALRRSKGAIVNNLSLAGLAALPMIPAYSISKAAAFSMTQSMRALLGRQGVTVHAAVLGPIDTDMSRGFAVPKTSPETAAVGIFDGLERGEEDIFPDPAALAIAEGWRNSVVKGMERQFAALVPANDYTASFAIDQSPEEVFGAINNVRGWWSEEIDGSTDKLGAEFTFRHRDVHRSTQKITELVPGKKVVWRVSNSRINFVKDKSEWDGTEVIFEIARKEDKTELRFTHLGLVPTIECYGGCSGAWGFYVNDSLRSLITTGKGKPIAAEGGRQ